MKKSELRKLIKEEIDNFGPSGEHNNIALRFNAVVEELVYSIEQSRNMEDWAEKYHRSAENMITIMDRLITVFDKMK